MDIDVSTVNKETKDLHQQVVSSQSRKRPNPFDIVDEHDADEDVSRARKSPLGTADAASRKDKAQRNQEVSSEVQILGLESDNPIVLYDNQLYSCRWTDLIGTNMFFTSHADDAEYEPISNDGDIDLAGMSRIKLLANKARLVPKERLKERLKDNADPAAEGGEGEDEPAVQPRAGAGLGALRSTNPKINIELKKQAHFLERLIDVKRARGETDLVRTIYEPKRGGSRKSRAHEKRNREELKAEILKLNKSVLQGDPDALSRLQEIYEQLNAEETNKDSAGNSHSFATDSLQPRCSSQTALSLQPET